jgi:hypothetical protein
LTILFNSGVIDEKKVYLLKELKSPIAYFIGGPKDIAYPNVGVATAILDPSLSRL